MKTPDLPAKEGHMHLTTEQIRDLAKLERDMDAGRQPFVVWGGQRRSVTPAVMTELGLEAGQTVSDALAEAILRAHIAVCEAQIALKKLAPGPDTST